eukprot:TRINITY_DN57344_c0_g1_i1.p1 TRINITY_DN57344_c0_g1~~TRINITY_DN57344_c0_g1_i1.p1  ORF type:complete len:358 (+),score=33.65 TRINITY_DN57344_c0_g1_i1:46-1119(+)
MAEGEKRRERPARRIKTANGFNAAGTGKCSSNASQEEPSLRDKLEKRGPMMMYGWKWHSCTLTKDGIQYFSDDECKDLKGTIELFAGARAFPFVEDAPGDAIKYIREKPCGFVVDPRPSGGQSRRLFYFNAPDKQVQINWLEGIANVVAPLDSLVTLHVYDVSTESVVSAANLVLKTIGTGAFHAAVEIGGVEWSYGYNDSETRTGVFDCEPKKCDMHIYRESIEMGRTNLSSDEVDELLYRLQKEWLGHQYDLLRRNCCVFSDTFCQELGVGPIPARIRNLAAAGGKLVDIGKNGYDKVKSPIKDVVMAGKAARGADQEADGYKFGDFTRGVVANVADPNTKIGQAAHGALAKLKW